MSVNPINLTRVSTNLRTISLLDSLRQNSLRLFLEQNKLATGYNINTPSDDPIGASQSINLQTLLERQDQILTNIRHADSFLSATDDAIGNMSDLLTQAQSIASEMASTTVDQNQRDASAELVQGILSEMVRTGNRQFNGMYLFGGTRTTQPPFAQSDGGVAYRGDLTNLFTQIDQAAETQYNLNGADLFGAVSQQVTGNVDLNPALSVNTRLVDIGGAAGKGIQRGLIQVTLSSPASSFTVDLSGADTIGDVLNAMNTAAQQAGLSVGTGGQFNATLNAAGNGIQLDSSSGTLSVQQVDDSYTARDLGLLGASGASISGADLQAKLTLTTPIADLLGGSNPALGSIQITSGAATQTIDLSGAQTVQDVLNTINSSGLNVRASINSAGSGIDVVSTLSGVPMSIGEAGGNTATLLGIRSLYGGTPLSSLNGGAGVQQTDGKPDFQIVAKNGSAVVVDLDGATTIQDVIDRINTAATSAGVALTAGLASTGNGIQITDSTGGAAELHVERLNLSYAIDGLGLNKSADVAGGNVLTSTDTNMARPDSVFTVLQDLYNSLRSGNSGGITDAGERLGNFISQASRMRGLVGARSQAVSARLNLTQDAVVATQKLLSDVRDTDYTEAVTKFQQAQTALQANLLTGSRLLQLSLLDFVQ